MNSLQRAIGLVAIFCCMTTTKTATAANIGVYYFPGWHNTAGHDTWAPIRNNGGLEPLLGWYEVSNPEVLNRQLGWMSQYGINFVVFDWYTEQKSLGLYRNPGVDGFLKSSAKGSVKFAILWANNARSPRSLAEYDDMVNWWIDQYFRSGSYYELNGKPVVLIVAPDSLAASASALGLTTKALLDRAKDLAYAKGVEGIYFVASTQALATDVEKMLPEAGFDALSAYNYHFGLAGQFVKKASSHSYSELASGYSQSWNWIVKNSKLPYLVPLTAGWDRKPWGGSNDPLHDNSESSPESFEAHLREGKALMANYPVQTGSTAIICCWNEFGEGSVVEPTKKYGFSYLEKIRNVFGSAAK
jgi:hypothetical protein